MKSNEYPRDLIGYGQNPPDPKWPGGARLALSFVLNYEEGGERCILHGDAESEAFLSEIPAAQPIEGQRHISMESIYEYGSRVGVWRILALFEKYNMPLTVFAVAMALERYPELAKVFVDAGHEICSHGYRWVDYQGIDPDLEKADMHKAISVIKALTGDRPLGWYTGRTSPNTRKLVAEEGGFLYDSDAYDDDLPYWHTEGKTPQLVIPYTLDVNDMRFATVQGFNSGEQFFQYLKDTFDTLYEEGERAPKMMSVGLHCRLIGKPGRIASLKRFLDYVQQHSDVWVCRRVDIAKHWHQHHPFETSDKK
ncbi:Allantoinase [Vibrio nigripulchritudo SFn27]|uniref:Allantoinase n=1 Tax=Vibrio nigripulchritudo TaxID=28173 RepID=U4KIS5_9VIBR|nr:allantoinase PuuE [Vibrio nigripulchritudo]CCN80656.1 Allantoinase [Vibrio nigripulchritudo BLFn1]CCN89997.1 Allantoinase [Vibrio nigripulchritudo SFn27]CCN93341.1 Allantoinase [Vibrio nigripulchritudo ENn2]CCO42229.1 Allantoinase [Vibrio nigripulchritudo SFn135]CCO55236.1 Allantoinase [Vibrio nigripulchritudo Wn13]